MEAAKILVVDDEEDIREILQFNLSHEGFHIDTAASGEEAFEKLSPEHALLLLDVMLGGISGYYVAERLRNDHNPIPIIFLTAKGSENDLLTGFSVGGDDYISKPFSIKEVIVRTKAVLRRNSAQIPALCDKPKKIVIGDLQLDMIDKYLQLRGRPVSLTKKEFEILSLMMRHPKQIFTRDVILHTIWKDDDFVMEHTVDVHIARLRKKLEEYSACINNRSGYGYSFNDSICIY